MANLSGYVFGFWVNSFILNFGWGICLVLVWVLVCFLFNFLETYQEGLGVPYFLDIPEEDDYHQIRSL